jgi:membrane protein implicated in regulation of membrane protease activity
VRVCGSVWSARSTDGAPIAAGTTVVVDRIEGVKLMVRPAKAPVGKA